MDLTFSLTKKMEKLIKKLEKRQKKLIDEYENKKEIILQNPGIGKTLKGDLSEYRVYDWTIQGTGIRLAYVYYMADNHIVFVYFGTRENFYQELGRYVN
ncbi:type II toxin-antitoxin system RelE/ParE family toxin [Bacillus cereus]|uniref:Type II toxin-antitoxin system RelE/ParE family toxin n=1 Tax=Bacillus cereus TaxID=1396 RepID=A0AAW5L3Q9_BACCE|nr:type II toxin-antitoxin system RelE/ParE family toxin [Bacillus cereus]MCQ6288901.1 type II toxin-antitoxin system RelE/ParE family toxin [Bacillus cereus]MCQ6318216.1 type II toxin-antitoxin system RelE/ParE family toxin [Bacillus cereus]MCQ6329883.1 type II toxin-antitoxin system RelE/ParE family toxin [Bacillus cereus]MCQ6385934.1 type II toxin-antitoxin system RelE/ParE family toxin [Bacillus cereus]